MTQRDITKTSTFTCGDDTILVQESDMPESFAWRLKVNEGDWSRWERWTYGGPILVHDGYALASSYWEGVLPVSTPFKIIEASPAQ